MIELPPLGLYIHIPWCTRKCPYCDFNSHAAGASLPETEYLQALINDMAFESQYCQNREIQSVFIGGGTPSLFSGATIARLLEASATYFNFADTLEITLEANPGTVTDSRLSDLRKAGINRLSLGIQSFNSQSLKALRRIHNATEAVESFQAARRAGFDNINMDLMYGLPQTPLTVICEDLNTATSLAPEHISWYQLTLEPNTEFFKHPPELPDDDLLADHERAGHELLGNHGYLRYEISAWSIPGRQCQHNLNYWQFGDYIGIGAGAQGKLSDLNGNIVRSRKARQPEHYLQLRQSVENAEALTRRWQLSNAELPLEFMMNILRLETPQPRSLFHRRTGLSDTVLQPALNDLTARELWSDNEQLLTISPRGRLFLNDVLLAFDEQRRKAVPQNYNLKILQRP